MQAIDHTCSSSRPEVCIQLPVIDKIEDTDYRVYSHLTFALHHKIDLAKLPYAEGATFDSHADELDSRCHKDTRLELRDQIKQWAREPQGKSVFWLCGIAGTGKSTVSRTAAQSFADDGQLAASFFFKRGEGDRGNARRLFSTLARQMVVMIPAMSSLVSEAIEVDPTLMEKSMKEQFEKIILQPFFKLSDPQKSLRRVIVIDALDECEREGDIKVILDLLSQVPNTASLSLRIFVTSRPELPVRLGFKTMAEGVYQDLILHEIPRSTIEHDIAVFLTDEFSKIRDTHNSLRPGHSLPSSWPGPANIQTLVEIAVPLFIFAATVCRFVADERWDPQEQLENVLKHQFASQASNLDRTYQPILDRLLIDLTVTRKDALIREFQLVVGSIVLLANPLSSLALSNLLGVPESTVDRRLDPLRSVFNIPPDNCAPVRMLHLSIREFLVDPEKQGKSPFWIDAAKTHELLSNKCLQLMSRLLTENICRLQSPGTLRAEIERQTVDHNLLPHLQYACQYWVYHLEQSGGQISDGDPTHNFLSNHFLHWPEALSLTGRLQEAAAMLRILEAYLTVSSSFYSTILTSKPCSAQFERSDRQSSLRCEAFPH